MPSEFNILQGDALAVLRTLPDESVNCCVTSPPYFGLRDYGVDGQMGLEKTPQEFVAAMVGVFAEVRRVLKKDGTCWVNIGDSYAASLGQRKSTDKAGPKQSSDTGSVGAPSRFVEGLAPKNLIGVPWRLAFALQDDGWYLRSNIIWAKPNGMPGSQLDRPTSSHEHLFLLSKSATYWSDFDAIKTPPRESSLLRTAQDLQAQAGSHRANGGAKTNGPMKAVGVVDKQRGHSRTHDGFNARWDAMEKTEQQSKPAMIRDVWFIAPATFSEAHFAVMPEELARRCVLAGCPENGLVLDPFNGAGTTGVVATRLGRNYLGIELNPGYIEMAERRIQKAIDTRPAAASTTLFDPIMSF